MDQAGSRLLRPLARFDSSGSSTKIPYIYWTSVALSDRFPTLSDLRLHTLPNGPPLASYLRCLAFLSFRYRVNDLNHTALQSLCAAQA